MTARPTRNSRRQYACPKDDKQDGVCGCPQFWQPKQPRSQAQSTTSARPSTPKAEIDVLKTPSPSPKPADPPQQTCFFWYHGTCRRNPCNMAHESHATWPLSPPPRFVHYEPYFLSLCPMRDDLVPSKKTLSRQLAGQLNRTAMSNGTRETPIEILSSDDKNKNENSGTRETPTEIYSSDDESESSDDENEYSNTDTSDNARKQAHDDVDSLPDYEDLTPLPEFDYLATLKNEANLKGENDISDRICPGGIRTVPPFFNPADLESPVQFTFRAGTYPNALEDDGAATPFEPGSLPLTGPYPDYSESECDTVMDDDAALDKQIELDSPLVDATMDTTETPTFSTADYIELSEFAPPQSPSDVDGDEPLMSLSHAGTIGLGKRSRATSPNEESNNKHARREESPGLDSFVSILQRKRQTNNWDLKPLDVNDLLPAPFTLQAPPQRKPVRLSTDREFARGDSPSPRSLPSTPLPYAPTGSRALRGSAPVCFYWYHQGFCHPKRRNGRPVRCTYVHDLDNPKAVVSHPRFLKHHDPDCQLPLCPIRLQQEAELHKDDNVPLDVGPDSVPEEDPHEKAESVKERGEKALKMVEALKMKAVKEMQSSQIKVTKSKGGKKAGKRAICLKIDIALAKGDAHRFTKSKGGKKGKKVDKKVDKKAGKKADKKARKKANRKARILRKRSATQKVDKLLSNSGAGLDWNEVFVRLFGTVE